jgi:uncharacterized protein YegL
MTNAGQELLLFYIVCDESGSMGPNGGIEEINKALPELHAEIAADPLAVDKSRLAIIAFSDDAELLLPLTRVSDVADMPGVQESGVTNYGKAFALLEQTITQDVDSLKAQGYRVYRPCVFFISDGEPTDDWEPAYKSLQANKYRPHVIAFGVFGADPTIIGQVATLKAFVGRDRTSAGRALASVIKSIGSTIITSTSTVAGATPDIQIPTNIDGFDTVGLETI